MNRRGFTLIELLVVISIISLLSTVVLSSLNSARAKGAIAAGRQFAGTAYRVGAEQALGIYEFEEGSGSAVDRSTNAGAATVTNATYSSDTQNGSGWSMQFNGSTAYLQSANNLGISGNPDFTMCAWVKWNGAFSGDYPSFMGNNSTGVAGAGLSFTLQSGRPAVDFWAWRWRSAVPIQANVWTHICGTKTAGTISATTKIYINGAIVAGAVEGTDSAPNITNAPAIIGRLDASRWWNGLVDSVHYYGKALVASEVGELYASEASRFMADAR